MAKKTSESPEKQSVAKEIGSRRDVLKRAVAAGLLTGAGLAPAAARDEHAKPRKKMQANKLPITKTRAIKIAPTVNNDQLLKRVDNLLSKNLQVNKENVDMTVRVIQDILPGLGGNRAGVLTIDVAAQGIDSTDCTGNACGTHGCPVHECTGEGCSSQGCGVQTCNGHGCDDAHGCAKNAFGASVNVSDFAQEMLDSAWTDLKVMQQEMMGMKEFIVEIRSPNAMQIQTRHIR